MRTHQYVERSTGRIVTERLCGDFAVNLLLPSKYQEDSSVLYKALSSRHVTEILGYLNFDRPFSTRFSPVCRFLHSSLATADRDELYENREDFRTLRDFFERKIRYWECRPMPEDETLVVSPADSRMVVGSFREVSELFLKEKFFSFEELIGRDKPRWLAAFSDGEFAVCRLTPEKYHYNHSPVSGIVVDFYEIDGRYHSCNPGAVVAIATPYSKNKRVVTVIDTDAPGGTGVGLVVMIEVVALMIGEILQCYSTNRYDAPSPVTPGMFLRRGQPKSLFRPGSSTVVLLFQRERIEFARDLIVNMLREDVRSRFSMGFGKSIVETEVDVRSYIAAGRRTS